MERLYFQYQPDETATERLITHQAVLDECRSGGEQIPVQELHFSLMHVGKLDQLYDSIRSVKPTLDRELFDANIKHFVSEAIKVIPPVVDAKPHRSILLGKEQRTLALSLKVSNRVVRAHEFTFHALRTCLRDSGIADVDNFIDQDRNLRNVRNLRPHITMKRGEFSRGLLHSPSLRDTLHLNMVPPGYDLKHDRST